MQTLARRTVDINSYNSIIQQQPADRTSNQYSYIPTTQVISVLEKHGWLPVLAGEVKVRKDDRKGFQKHIIKFANPSVTLQNSDALCPEIVLTNSHDGFASFCLQAGLFRFVCSNGMIVADSVFSKHRIRHQGYTDDAVSLAIEEICDTVPTIGGKVEEFQGIELTKDEKGIFANAALIAKYGEDAMREREFSTDRLLTAYRRNDEQPTLWATLNTVQEKLIKGGRFELKQDTRYRSDYKRPKQSRGVNSISENIRINQALWQLTEKMAELKA